MTRMKRLRHESMSRSRKTPTEASRYRRLDFYRRGLAGGEVLNLMTSARASWTAWQVPGVKSVKNDLTVKEKA